MKKEATAEAAPKASAKREAILEAAVAVFSRYGFKRAAVDDVAREAGVAKGTLYLYYESKEDLFRAVAERLGEQILAAVERARVKNLPAAERLRLVLEAKFLAVFDLLSNSPHAAELLDSKGRLAADVFHGVDRRYEAAVAAVLAEGVAGGELDLSTASLTPATAAAFVVRVAHGLETPDAAGAAPSREVYRKRIAEMVRVLVAGLGGERRGAGS